MREVIAEGGGLLVKDEVTGHKLVVRKFIALRCVAWRLPN